MAAKQLPEQSKVVSSGPFHSEALAEICEHLEHFKQSENNEERGGSAQNDRYSPLWNRIAMYSS